MAGKKSNILLWKVVSQNSEHDFNGNNEIRIDLARAAHNAIEDAYAEIDSKLIKSKLLARIRILREKSSFKEPLQ
jgi:hypothetical protein